MLESEYDPLVAVEDTMTDDEVMQHAFPPIPARLAPWRLWRPFVTKHFPTILAVRISCGGGPLVNNHGFKVNGPPFVSVGA